MERYPGYQFYPSQYSPALGHPKVDIYLMSEPAGRFFDTFQAAFLVPDQGDVKELLIEHPWNEWMGNPHVQILPGRFQLREKDGDLHYGFSLGGEIEIKNIEAATVCTVTSSAPIFNLSDDPDALGDVIANEVEGLLARREAAWGENVSGYARRLANAEPLSLFIAILHTLVQDFQNLPAAVRSHGYQKILHQLNLAAKILEGAGKWPEKAPDIQDLL